VTIRGGATDPAEVSVRLVDTICRYISIVARVVKCWRASGASITVCETRSRQRLKMGRRVGAELTYFDRRFCEGLRSLERNFLVTFVDDVQMME